jgi:hypothetical protein
MKKYLIIFDISKNMEPENLDSITIPAQSFSDAEKKFLDIIKAKIKIIYLV